MAAIPQNLLDEIRDLKRRLRAIEGRAHIRPAMNQVLNGDVVIGEGGTLKVVDTDGSSQLFIGGIAPAHPDGSPQRGFILRREDGTIALALYTASDAPQSVNVWDDDGNLILAEDSGNWGLARPYLEVPMSAGKDFEGTSWQTTHIGRWVVQNPVLRAEYSVYTGTGTVEARLEMSDESGTLVPVADSTVSSTDGAEAFATLTLRPDDHGLSFGDVRQFFLRARRTVGTGLGTVWCRGFYGRQT